MELLELRTLWRWLAPGAPRMIALARRQAAKTEFEVEFLQQGAEAISLPDRSVDTVFSTFTFCTIPDLPRALSEIAARSRLRNPTTPGQLEAR